MRRTVKKKKSMIKWALVLAFWLPTIAAYVGYTAIEDRHKQELQECAEELIEPNKCGKIWQYAASLENENARLNKKLSQCREASKETE